MNGWITIPYAHDPGNTEPLWIGIAGRGNTPPTEWIAAFRDTQNGQRVLTAQIPIYGNVMVWVKDSAGERPVRAIRA